MFKHMQRVELRALTIMSERNHERHVNKVKQTN